MKNSILIAAVAILFSTGCKKDGGVTEGPTLSLADFNNKFSVPTQLFNGVAGTGFSITGNKGIKLDFPANAFLDASGNQVTGNIKLSLKEVMTKGDILLSGKMTESNKQLLVSGGEFQVLALKNGQLLKLNPAAEVMVKVPTTLSTSPMDLFEFKGTTSSDSTWMLNQKARVTTTPTYYQFALPNFGWVNCDYFYNNPNPKTTITASPVYAGASPSIKDQRAYLIFDAINNVIGLPFELSINKHQSYLNSMPIGMTGKLVIISVDMDDRIYFGYSNFTISNGLHVNVPVAVSTQADIDNFLSAIN
ncbi:hypothetical protein [Pedobacter insulae]|uniref:Uncharacterized protein n=1 Tax=Pedobacter insulae TaxID=414048 RepID=A0A1I2Y0A4_9SPHI|nr:hypothetical protein [Pedobacter insulae]SFH18416.1 hypothetical protein SAMN04489864_106118 [Pedobacter insulae]